MPGRLGPRFAVEAAFLIVLAVGAAVAQLSPQWIVLVMGIGWILVGLFEFTADRLSSVFPPLQRYGLAAPPERVERPREAPEPHVEAATVVVPPSERLDEEEAPPAPRWRRRWFRFRRSEPEEDTEENVTEPPRHVRLLPRGQSAGGDEIDGLASAAEQEERR